MFRLTVLEVSVHIGFGPIVWGKIVRESMAAKVCGGETSFHGHQEIKRERKEHSSTVPFQGMSTTSSHWAHPLVVQPST